MKQIIKIEDNNVFIGTETNEIIRTVLSAVSYENPQVGDNVEVYKNIVIFNFNNLFHFTFLPVNLAGIFTIYKCHVFTGAKGTAVNLCESYNKVYKAPYANTSNGD